MIPAQGKDGVDGKDGKDGTDGAPGPDGKDGKDGAKGAKGAKGADGKDGITPQLRINTDFYWEMSIDGGTTWQLLLDADKNPIKAQGPQGSQGPAGQPGDVGEKGLQGDKGEPGEDGDPQLTITETDDAITIIYKGVTYTIYKEVGPTGPPLNPLSLVAEYNVNPEGTVLTGKTACTRWLLIDDAIAFTDITIVAIGTICRAKEWLFIAPKAINSADHYVDLKMTTRILIIMSRNRQIKDHISR